MSESVQHDEQCSSLHAEGINSANVQKLKKSTVKVFGPAIAYGLVLCVAVRSAPAEEGYSALQVSAGQ